MLQDSKGKVKEDAQWQLGWWDVHPLVEVPSRPIEWSSTSVIYTAHPTQPLVVARHFSSSRQFTVVCPTPVLGSPTSYLPPTIISASPTDEWLFAFFPGSADVTGGISCLWSRGSSLDSWTVKDHWPLAQNRGIVSAAWLGGPRQYGVDSSGKPTRLGSCGPITPVTSPTLALITEDHKISICYIRPPATSIKIMTSSLLATGVTLENQSFNLPAEQHDRNVSVCIKTSVSLVRNEPSIMVAMRSRRYPVTNVIANDMPLMDLGVPLELDQNQLSDLEPSTDRTLGEASDIELCEVKFLFNGTSLTLETHVLPPIQDRKRSLNSLCFVTEPPTVSKNAQSRPYPVLAVGYLDFGSYSSMPESELVVYSPKQEGSLRTYVEATKRKFEDKVLSFVLPASSHGGGLYVGLIDLTGNATSAKRTKRPVPIGSTQMLNILTLENAEGCEPQPILSSAQLAGKEVPVSVALSPNDGLLCMHSTSLWTVQQATQLLPRPKSNPAANSLVALAAAAIINDKSTQDIAHILSSTRMPQPEVVEILCQIFTALDDFKRDTYTLQSLGLALEVYRMACQRMEPQNGEEKEQAIGKWKALHDMCSLLSISAAFEDCSEGSTYDLDAVWQLISLSTWTLHFLERLAKECILTVPISTAEDSSDELFGSSLPGTPATATAPVTYSPILLLLVQPLSLKALKSAISHVARWRSHLDSLTASGENAKIAKDVLVSLVEESAIVDMTAMEDMLSQFLTTADASNVGDQRWSLASCEISVTLVSNLRSVVQKVAESPAIDRTRLLLKPDELMDGGNIASVLAKKEDHWDVVTKATLSPRQTGGGYFQCSRCGGSSEIGQHKTDSRSWYNWENLWGKNCICGGLWLSQVGYP